MELCRQSKITSAMLAVMFLSVGLTNVLPTYLLSSGDVAWASDDDDDDDRDVEEVIVEGERPRSLGHPTGGGTGQTSPPLLGSTDYNYYGSVQCPLSPFEAINVPDCSCPVGWVKRKQTIASGPSLSWCDPPTHSCPVPTAMLGPSMGPADPCLAYTKEKTRCNRLAHEWNPGRSGANYRALHNSIACHQRNDRQHPDCVR